MRAPRSVRAHTAHGATGLGACVDNALSALPYTHASLVVPQCTRIVLCVNRNKSAALIAITALYLSVAALLYDADVMHSDPRHWSCQEHSALSQR